MTDKPDLLAERCIRCRIAKMWTVDGKELCMGCSIVIRQTRILELEREAIMGMVEIDSLRTQLALAEAVCQAASSAFRFLIEDKYCYVPDGKQRESMIFGDALAAWRAAK